MIVYFFLSSSSLFAYSYLNLSSFYNLFHIPLPSTFLGGSFSFSSSSSIILTCYFFYSSSYFLAYSNFSLSSFFTRFHLPLPSTFLTYSGSISFFYDFLEFIVDDWSSKFLLLLGTSTLLLTCFFFEGLPFFVYGMTYTSSSSSSLLSLLFSSTSESSF